MKYAVNREGILAMRTMAAAIKNAIEVLNAETKKVDEVAASHQDALGPHKASLDAALKDIEDALKDATDPAEDIAENLEDVAEGYEDIIEHDGIGASTGNVVGAGVVGAAAAGAGDAGRAMSENSGYSPSGASSSTDVGASSRGTLQDNADYLVYNGFCENADFGGLDIRTAEDMRKGIAETVAEFPELNMNFVGSLQARDQKMKSTLEQYFKDNYWSAYVANFPGKSDAEILQLIEQDTNSIMSQFDHDDNTIAQSVSPIGDNTIADALADAFRGISINESCGGDYDKFVQIRKNDVDSGFKPQNCYSPRATVDHELGHQIAKLTKAHEDPDIQEWYRQFMELNNEGKASVLSGYAATNIHEFIAEAWSEYRNNPTCRPLARSIAERMRELYDAQKKVKVLRR